MKLLGDLKDIQIWTALSLARTELFFPVSFRSVSFNISKIEWQSGSDSTYELDIVGHFPLIAGAANALTKAIPAWLKSDYGHINLNNIPKQIELPGPEKLSQILESYHQPAS